MTSRVTVVAGVAVGLMCAACASMSPEQDASLRPEKIYRTGSNIPAKDYGAENVEVAKPDASSSINRPGMGVLSRKPGN